MWAAAQNIRTSFMRNPVLCEEPVNLDEPLTEKPTAASSSTPVQYEMYPKEFQQITQQDNFDGFRLEAGNAILPMLQLSHSLILGTSLSENGYLYNFGPIFQSQSGRSVVIGKLGLDRSLNARIIQKMFGDAGEFKLNGNYNFREKQRNMYEAAFDYTGGSWCTSLKVCWQMAWIFNGSISKVITPNLQLGGEMIKIGVQNGGHIYAGGFRFQDGQDTFTGTLNRSPDFKNPMKRGLCHSAKLQYVRKVSDRLQLGTELEVSMPYMESSMKVGYEYAFRMARVQGAIDSSGKVSCVVSDWGGFGISGMIDYIRGDYKFGFMLQMYPAPEEAPPEGAAP